MIFTKTVVNKSYLIIFITTLIFGTLIAGGIIVQNNALQTITTLPSPSPLISPSPISLPSPTLIPSPSPELELILSDYQVLALNGVGGKGVAAAVKDLLETKDFTRVEADNADQFDHQLTIIQSKQNTPEKIISLIEQILSESYQTTRSAELLQKDSQYDVIITVGLRK